MDDDKKGGLNRFSLVVNRGAVSRSFEGEDGCGWRPRIEAIV